MINYTLTRSKRKTIALSVSKDLTVIVKAPLKMPKRDIEAFVAKHADNLAGRHALARGVLWLDHRRHQQIRGRQPAISRDTRHAARICGDSV